MEREESTQSSTIEELKERRAKKQEARRRQVRVYRGILAGGMIAFIMLCSIFVLAGRQQREPAVSESIMESQASLSLESAENSLPEATPSEILETEESEAESDASGESITEAESDSSKENMAEPDDILETTETESGAAAQETIEETEGTPHTAIVNVETYLNIRISPADDAVILAQMEAGTVCEILETGNPWYHIRYEGMEGYVNGEYLVFGDEE